MRQGGISKPIAVGRLGNSATREATNLDEPLIW